MRMSFRFQPKGLGPYLEQEERNPLVFGRLNYFLFTLLDFILTQVCVQSLQ